MPVPENNLITVRLVPRPVIQQQAPAADEPTDDSMPATPIETDADAQAAVGHEVSANADEAPTADPRGTGESITQADRAPALRATLLDQVRSLPADADGEGQGKLPWTSSGERIPGVPGLRGWISGYVGTVAPSAQTWRENDGSSRGRYVLADGTAICTRRRAPTIDELINPWKSTAVTTGSICGRERPEAPGFSDPRVQPPPSAAGRQPASGRQETPD